MLSRVLFPLLVSQNDPALFGEKVLSKPKASVVDIGTIVPRVSLLLRAWDMLQEANPANRDLDAESRLREKVEFLRSFCPNDAEAQAIRAASDLIDEALSPVDNNGMLSPGVVGPLLYDVMDVAMFLLEDVLKRQG